MALDQLVRCSTVGPKEASQNGTRPQAHGKQQVRVGCALGLS